MSCIRESLPILNDELNWTGKYREDEVAVGFVSCDKCGVSSLWLEDVAAILLVGRVPNAKECFLNDRMYCTLCR